MTLMKLKARVHIRLAEPHVSVCDLSACDLRGPSFRGFCVFLFFWGPFPLFLGGGGEFLGFCLTEGLQISPTRPAHRDARFSTKDERLSEERETDGERERTQFSPLHFHVTRTQGWARNRDCSLPLSFSPPLSSSLSLSLSLPSLSLPDCHPHYQSFASFLPSSGCDGSLSSCCPDVAPPPPPASG